MRTTFRTTFFTKKQWSDSSKTDLAQGLCYICVGFPNNKDPCEIRVPREAPNRRPKKLAEKASRAQLVVTVCVADSVANVATVETIIIATASIIVVVRNTR